MENDDLAQTAVYLAIMANPFYGCKELLAEVRQVEGLEDMSLTFLKDSIRSWGWTWRKTKKKLINKFTLANMERYLDFVELFPTLDMTKIKYMDESGFKPRDLTCSMRVGPKGADLAVVDAFPNEKKLCLALLVCLDNPAYPAYFNISEGKSDRWNFFDFIIEAIDEGYIRSGDWIVFDNAPTHTAHEMMEALAQRLEEIGARAVFLPAYSPELNPCEMVFAFLKHFLRNHFRIAPLQGRLMEALQEISYESIQNYFRHVRDTCIKMRDAAQAAAEEDPE